MQTPSVKDTGPSGAQLFVVARGPADAVGVYYGNFKRDVRPLLQERLEGTAKDLRVTLSQLVRRASSLDGAVHALRSAAAEANLDHGEAIFRGPNELPGLSIGDVVPPGSDSEPESNVSEPEELMGDSQRWCAGSGGTGNPTPPLPPDAPPHADLWRLGPFVLMTLIQVCVMAISMPYLSKDRGARALGALVAHGAEGLGAWCPIILPMVVLLLLVPSLLPQANWNCVGVLLASPRY